MTYTGSIHVLAAGSLIHLPFLFAPSSALGLGVLTVTLRVFDLLREPFKRGTDSQPLVLSIGVHLLGVGCSRLGVLELLGPLMKHREDAYVQTWLGRWCLPAFLVHQAVL